MHQKQALMAMIGVTVALGCNTVAKRLKSPVFGQIACISTYLLNYCLLSAQIVHFYWGDLQSQCHRRHI
jgi:hypothetical protein